MYGYIRVLSIEEHDELKVTAVECSKEKDIFDFAEIVYEVIIRDQMIGSLDECIRKLLYSYCTTVSVI